MTSLLEIIKQINQYIPVSITNEDINIVLLYKQLSYQLIEAQDRLIEARNMYRKIKCFKYIDELCQDIIKIHQNCEDIYKDILRRKEIIEQGPYFDLYTRISSTLHISTLWPCEYFEKIVFPLINLFQRTLNNNQHNYLNIKITDALWSLIFRTNSELAINKKLTFATIGYNNDSTPYSTNPIVFKKFRKYRVQRIKALNSILESARMNPDLNEDLINVITKELSTSSSLASTAA